MVKNDILGKKPLKEVSVKDTTRVSCLDFVRVLATFILIQVVLMQSLFSGLVW